MNEAANLKVRRDGRDAIATTIRENYLCRDLEGFSHEIFALISYCR